MGGGGFVWKRSIKRAGQQVVRLFGSDLHVHKQREYQVGILKIKNTKVVVPWCSFSAVPQSCTFSGGYICRYFSLGLCYVQYVLYLGTLLSIFDRA